MHRSLILLKQCSNSLSRLVRFNWNHYYDNQKLSKEGHERFQKKKTMNTFYKNIFLKYFLMFNFGSDFDIFNLDCTYHTTDQAAPRDNISRRLNPTKVKI